jgi:membrane protein DedA with SNARE-associated domain
MALLHGLGGNLDHLLQAYGLWAVALLIFLESTGVPSPGETMLIAAGTYAGSTHRLNVVEVVLVAIVAAVVGDNLGYWVGRKGGWPLLRRYRRVWHIDDATLKIGVYLFRRHGGMVVFIGRFVPLLRTYGALLAGVNRFPWSRFLFWNGTSAIAWATVWGTLAFVFGSVLRRYESIATLATLSVALTVTVVAGVVIRRRRKELAAAAERAFPGDVERIAA